MQRLFAFAFLFSSVALAQPAPSITSVVNAGSNDARFCPGLLITIVGNNFGSVAGAVSVIFAGQTAGVIDVNNNIIHAQLPLSLANVSTTLSVNVGGASSGPFPMTVDSFAPAFYGGSTVISPNPAAPGQTVTALLVGLGATNPPVSVGTIPTATAPTATTPTVSVGGTDAMGVSAVVSNSAAGVYLVSFTMPANAPVGTTEDVIVSIGGKSTPKTTIVLGGPVGGPAVTAVFNAGKGSGLSPGVLATITGQSFNAPTVTIGAKPAFIIQTGPSALLVELPVDLPLGPTTLTVSSGGTTTTPFNVTINAFAPAFYGLGFMEPNGAPYNAANPAGPGKKVIGQMVGLGATNPLVPTGQAASTQASTTATPSLMVGGKTAMISYCGLVPGSIGVYELDFTVPDDVPAGTPDAVLTIGGVASPPQTLFTSSVLPTLIGFRNAASGQLLDGTHGIAPNTFLSIYASNIGTVDSTVNLFPSRQYQGTMVYINAIPVPLYNVIPSANLINLVVPSELAESGAANVAIVSPTGTSQNLTLTLAATDVGIFRIPPDASNPARQIAAATIANSTWVVLPAATAAAYKYAPCPAASLLTACAGPAHPGDAVVIYFTGGGRATPNGNPSGNTVATGQVAPVDGSVVYKTIVAPTLTIGGIQAHVDFSGIAPGTAAEYQINTTIPAGVQPGDDVAVVLTIGNSSDTVTIAVKNP
jgi:uncharacterized protein (TIGR03437 family)